MDPLEQIQFTRLCCTDKPTGHGIRYKRTVDTYYCQCFCCGKESLISKEIAIDALTRILKFTDKLIEFIL